MKKKLVAFLAFIMIFNTCLTGVGASDIEESYYGSGPIRSMTVRGDGIIVGGRSSGHAIEVWSSADKGSSWTRIGTVAANENCNYGDVMFLAVPNSNTIYCAFRLKENEKYSVTVCRSEDGGINWVYDSTVIGGQEQFVGAPWLFIANNGDMQCYYDSEPLATQNGVRGAQWIAMQGRQGLTGSWDKYGVVAASRDADASKFVRDGMASVVDLGNNRIMVVTEGIEDSQSGGVYSNVVRAIQSFDGGYTWDYAGRRIVYQCGTDAASGRRYNAYCPMAIRVGGGPVGVVFCTDEDFGGTPDASSEVVSKRRTHIKYIRTLDTFESWGGLTPVWTDGSSAYAPGMIETASNEILISIDHFSGNQRFYQMDVLGKSEETQPETTGKEPETTTAVKEPETTTKTIDGGIEINGYQISATAKGMRTVYSVDSKINEKDVISSGVIYSLVGYAQDSDMYVGSTSTYVKSFQSTPAGVCARNFADSDISTSYTMTMKFATGEALEYMQQFKIRAYALLSDGTYVYTDTMTYSAYDVADKLYKEGWMHTQAAHNYLYTDILSVVDKDYEAVDYNWAASLMRSE